MTIAHRKLWECGLYQPNDRRFGIDQDNLADRWWLGNVTTDEEAKEMGVFDSIIIDTSNSTINKMYALFFALYFADEGEQDVIEV